METLTDNIIGIDFMHKNKLHFDVQTRQVKIAGIEGDQIVAIKEQVLPALASMVITARYKGKPEPNVHFIASIFAPKNPMLSRMPAIGTIDKNNNCKIVIDSVPYDVTIDRNKKLPKLPKRQLRKTVIATKAHLNVPNEYKQKYIDILYKHQKTLDWHQILNTGSTSNLSQTVQNT